MHQRAKQSLTHTQVTIEVDGVARPGRWGMQELVLDAGEHRIAVEFRYCRGARGRAELRIVVDPEAVVDLEYVAPRFMFFTHGHLDVRPA